MDSPPDSRSQPSSQRLPRAREPSPDPSRGGRLHPPGTFHRSVLTSLFTTALDFGTLTGLVELLHVNYVLATWLGTVIGSLSNFAINRRWAFDAAAAPRTGQFLRFVLVQAGASGWHTLGVWLLTRFVGVPYQASKLLIAATVYLAWNYPMNRWFVFRRGGQPSGERGANLRGSPSR